MTDRAVPGHSRERAPNACAHRMFGGFELNDRGTDEARASAPAIRASERAEESFEQIYENNVGFVHRSVRRLGIPDSAVEDVVQEVFLVAFRRLAEFRGESSLSTWIYGIAVRVVRLHRRTTTRADLHGVIARSGPNEMERIADARGRLPDASAEVADAYRMLLRLLDQLDDEKREIFVLAELEQLPVPEIASILGLKLNTAYSRLRLARAAFQEQLEASRRST